MAFAHPRSQTVVVSVACVVIIAIAIFWTKHGAVPSEKTADLQNNAAISTDAGAPISATSTDWKKSFLTGDISTGKAKTISSSTAQEPDTMTATLGKETLSSYLALQNAGLDTDTTAVNAATQNIISSTLNSKTAEVYYASDIKITPRSDDVIMTNFSTAIAHSISLYNATQSEVLIAKQSMIDKNPDLLKKIDPIIANYKQIIASLKSIETPSVMSTDMLTLLNGFSQMKFVAEALRVSDKDPLLAMVGANTYLNGVGDIVDSIRNMRTYLNSRNMDITLDTTFLQVMLSNN